MTTKPTIQDAKRIIAASSLEGMRILGAGVSRECSPARYNQAASAALADPDAQMTPEERRTVAIFISSPNDDEPEDRAETLRVRLTKSEKAELRFRADAEGMDLSDYVRHELAL
jgi:hypothetical protein